MAKNSNLQTTVHLLKRVQWMHNFNGINTLGIQKKEALQVALKAEASRDKRRLYGA